MQLMMIGLMAVKKFKYAALMIPLPLFTMTFKIIMDKNYKRPLSVLSLRAAHDLDIMDATLDEQQHLRNGEQEDSADVQKGYVHPAMKVDWNELHKLLDEAATALDMLEQTESRQLDEVEAGKEQA